MSTLYLVGVPIGNWDDITIRAIATLKEVDIIAAEDTRKSKKLLDHLYIRDKKIISHHSANEKNSSEGIIQLLEQGSDVAFISDAGMPGISDPGFLLARFAIEKDIQVTVIPGVSASTTAVVGSGLPCDNFFFQGFLPRQKSKQLKLLKTLNSYGETLVFYESPRRVLDTLDNMRAVFGGERDICLARELTKTHEEVVRTDINTLYKILNQREAVLGEIVLVVAGEKNAASQTEEETDTFIQQSIENNVPVKVLKKELAEKLSISAAEAYKIILAKTK
jgi:16S rRNA (cytidine1402-2'-O)-methyltransferase